MSTSTGFADYRAALTAPGARWPVLASLLGRLPIAMIGLAVLLYVHRQTGSYATASLASAGALIGVAGGSVVQGRLMDRFGPTRPLLCMVGLFTVLIVALVAAVEWRAATPVIVTLAFCGGGFQPMIGSASRSLWPRLLPPGPARQAGYAYEAISLEVFFVLGPGLAGILTATPWAGTGVVVGAACMIGGSTGLALTPQVRSWRPDPAAHRGAPGPLGARSPGESGGPGRLGALATPGMRTVALAALGFGVVIGFSEVAAPAAATIAGRPTVGGLLLSLWSLGSVVFGVFYGVRPWPRSMPLRLPALLGVFSALVGLLALPSSLGGLAVLMLLAGLPITPQSTAHSTAIEEVAPVGTETEAFGWVITAVTLGAAFGQSVSGQLVEFGGPPLAFLAAGVAGLGLAGLLWLRRGGVHPDGAAPPEDTPLPDNPSPADDNPPQGNSDPVHTDPADDTGTAAVTREDVSLAAPKYRSGGSAGGAHHRPGSTLRHGGAAGVGIGT